MSAPDMPPPPPPESDDDDALDAWFVEVEAWADRRADQALEQWVREREVNIETALATWALHRTGRLPPLPRLHALALEYAVDLRPMPPGLHDAAQWLARTGGRR